MCVYSNHEHKTKFIVGYLIFFPIFLFSGFQKNKTKIGIHYDFVHANQNKTKTTQRNTEPQNTSLASHSNCLNAINRYVDARKVSICSLLLICRTKKHFGISLTIFNFSFSSISVVVDFHVQFVDDASSCIDAVPRPFPHNLRCQHVLFSKYIRTHVQIIVLLFCLNLVFYSYNNNIRTSSASETLKPPSHVSVCPFTA